MEITKRELKKILVNHKHWLDEDVKGWQDMKADLHGMDLSHADLRGANLQNVNLRGANLSSANLQDANLQDVNLQDANLQGAYLYSANLKDACLRNAYLKCATLTCANLCDANLCFADLKSANLSYAILVRANLNSANLFSAFLYCANLCGANLQGADLSRADLEDANLSHTNLDNAVGNLIEYRKGKIITEPLTVYKKCRDNIIVTLEIPRGATVFSINGNKCRTNKVKVLAIDGADRAMSLFNDMSYYVGDEITIHDFNCQYNVNCATGIHFFVDKKVAEQY